MWVRVRAYVSNSLCVCGKGFVRMFIWVCAYVSKSLVVCG